MRKRELIEEDTKPYDKLTLEVLLDLRDLLVPKKGTIIPKKRGTKKIRISH